MLYRNRRLAFTTLRDGLGLTDGNVASHTRRLEDAGYVKSGRVLNGLTFHVVYKITGEGSKAYRDYIASLRSILAAVDGADDPAVAPERRDSAPSSRAEHARDRPHAE